MNINSSHQPWHGLRQLVWEKRDKRMENENLINMGDKDIHIQ